VRPRFHPAYGLTLIEIMVTLAILAIVAAIAMPNYSAYLQRSRVPVALDGLSAFYTRMEQRYQDTQSYARSGACGASLPPAAGDFSFTCTLTGGGTGFQATATGSGRMSGYAYRIDERGVRTTVTHPSGVPTTACWSTRGKLCDA
jgi:type IV pilus assembly protein PilE